MKQYSIKNVDLSKISMTPHSNSSSLLMCTKCPKEFKTKNHLQKHSKRHYLDGLKPSFPCSLCPKLFRSRELSYGHEKYVHGEKTHQCGQCQRWFITKRYLAKHDCNHIYEYNCEQCDHKSVSKEKLNVHMKNIHNENFKSFYCDICSKAFVRKLTMKQHRLDHTGEKAFQCNECGKQFKTNFLLKYHMVVHNGADSKKFVCGICSKYFPRINSYERHMKMHTEEKRFICTVCSKDFFQLINLQTHERLHSGDHPYKCTVCDKTFIQLSNLKSHKQKHGHFTNDPDEYKKVTDLGHNLSEYPCKNEEENDNNDKFEYVANKFQNDTSQNFLYEFYNEEKSEEDKGLVDNKYCTPKSSVSEEETMITFEDDYEKEETSNNTLNIDSENEGFDSGTKEDELVSEFIHPSKILDDDNLIETLTEPQNEIKEISKVILEKPQDSIKKVNDITYISNPLPEEKIDLLKTKEHFRTDDGENNELGVTKIYDLDTNIEENADIKSKDDEHENEDFNPEQERSTLTETQTEIKEISKVILETPQDSLKNVNDIDYISNPLSEENIDLLNAKEHFQTDDREKNEVGVTKKYDLDTNIEENEDIKIKDNEYENKDSYPIQERSTILLGTLQEYKYEDMEIDALKTTTDEYTNIHQSQSESETKIQEEIDIKLEEHQEFIKNIDFRKISIAKIEEHEDPIQNVDLSKISVTLSEKKVCVSNYGENDDSDIKKENSDFEIPNVKVETVEDIQESFIVEKTCKCKECEKVFLSNCSLIGHHKLHKKENSESEIPSVKVETVENIQESFIIEQTYKCKECEKVFPSNRSLIGHRKLHTREKPKKCDVCEKVFLYMRDLETHRRLHTDGKPYWCDKCGKGFLYKHNLVTHERVHSDEKPYLCDKCDKTFRNIANLEVHQTVHTDERPYQCDICGKGNKTFQTYRNHLRLHNGDDRYKCDICEKQCTTKQKLEIHKRLHSGERPYVCDVCSKDFSQTSRLTAHMRLHTGENT